MMDENDDMANMNFWDVFSDAGDGEPTEEVTKADDVVSTLNKCESQNAKGLYIFDISYKLQCNDQYDIGGTYNCGTAELWFHYTTTTCPGDNYLLNLFVYHKNTGMFSLGISNSSSLQNTHNKSKIQSISMDLVWLKFNSIQPNTVHFVKTFCFSEKDRLSLQSKILFIPISINMKSACMLDTSVLQKIKAEHNFGQELLKGTECDFVLKSSSGKEYKVHKIVLAAHSPVLRDAIRSAECNSYNININDNELELLLEYLYTGAIKDIQNQKYEVLLDMSNRFKLDHLSEIVKNAIQVFINTSNALSLAVLADKYNYENIQEVIFRYIQLHPEALESDVFSQINNASIVKKLLKYIHSSPNKQK